MTAQRCLVTGGSGNLGRAICLELARTGAKVALTFHEDAAGAEATRSALGGNAIAIQGSVTDAAHADAAVAAVVQAWGGLDVLINNAAITQVLPFALVEEADWDRVMAVNVKGAYLMARAALRPMIRQKAGRILNVGAFGQGRVTPAPVHYAASKGALAGLTDALAREVARHGILVNLVDPGILEGGLGRAAPASRLADYVEQHPAGRFGSFDELARSIVWLCSPANTFITGAQIPIDGGI
ncbi:MAG: SDR family oxidoreductase [Deltaproteobacteria bacterium]|nr:SDR family oxidoreductase [Deltaproteobacteria bacterium]